MKNILVVDDAVAIRTMLNALLTAKGHRVVEAAGGRAGLEKIRQGSFDLVITDLNMPGLDGLGMVKAIRAGDANPSVPIMVLTTETAEAMKAQLRAAGANGWMSKPLTPERLDKALEKFLSA